jgi:tetratricopeptide (TPR) repeat protein
LSLAWDRRGTPATEFAANPVAPALLCRNSTAKIGTVTLTEFTRMRGVIPFLLLVSLPLPVFAAGVSSEDELRFGIDVAKRGLWNEARFRFEKAVELDPDNAEALNDLAVALEQQGEFVRAREAYEKAIKLKPGSLYIQQNYDLFREADDKRNRKAKKKS